MPPENHTPASEQGQSGPVAAAPAVPAPASAALAGLPLFAGLNSQELALLQARMERTQFPVNQTVFWRGERGEHLYVIESGRAAVTIPSDEGKHVTVDVLGPGQVFGEISMLDGGPRTATVRALEPLVLRSLAREQFQAFLRSSPSAAIHMLAVMGQRQRASTEALRHVANPNIVFHKTRTTWWQRASDLIARMAASQWFTLFHAAWFGLWIVINLLASAGWLPGAMGFDPFPFGLLTMCVSLEAIFLSIFVLVSQNRQAEKDRVQIDLDYQVNLKAQTEIMNLSRKLDAIELALASGAVPAGQSGAPGPGAKGSAGPAHAANAPS